MRKQNLSSAAERRCHKSSIQGDSLLDQQTLRGDSGHEDKHYKIGNHDAQTPSVEARGH